MNIKKIISLPYQIAHALRVNLYKALGLYHHKKLPVPVISIGNLSFGGTGKTPTSIAIANFFANNGYKVCVLTRGYKSKNNKKTTLINCKLENIDQFKAESIGDEACEMLEAFHKNNHEIILGIGKDRYSTGLEAIQKFNCNLIILDDALQHIQLDRDIEIILKNINEEGFLREFDLAEKKADFVIYTKVNKNWQKQHPEKISASFNLSLTKELDTNKGIGIFTGIGDPKTFFSMVVDHLKEKNLSNIAIKKFFFPDHYQFNLEEVTRVLTLGINLISTKKDLVKIPKELRASFIVTELKLEFNPNDFLEMLLDKVRNLNL